MNDLENKSSFLELDFSLMYNIFVTIVTQI